MPNVFLNPSPLQLMLSATWAVSV